MATSVAEDHPVVKEQEHVHQVYSQIASHFSDTRYKPWPRIAEFLQSLPAGSLVTDVGCGNGKYLGVNENVFMLGSDICPELVAIAKGRGQVMVSDCLTLPYKDNMFDAAICIAVLHHLSTEERRREGISEMVRVLRHGGRGLIYVWAMEQKMKKFTSQDVMVPWHMQLKYLPQGAGLTDSHPAKKTKKRRKKKLNNKGELCTVSNDSSPILSPSIDHTPSYNDTGPAPSSPQQLDGHAPSGPQQLDGFQTYYRYYHVFREGELVKLCESVAGVCVVDSWLDHENWCVLLQKK